ncbi:MAG TPA: heme ABC exporter ATP-binding protein CcmA, partial [Candidatus Angelobacter sp.]
SAPPSMLPRGRALLLPPCQPVRKHIEVTLSTQAPPVQVQNVSKIYGRTAVLRDVSLQLEAGRFYVLRGENGAGKSTLMRIVAGLSRPTHGSVQIFGQKGSEQLAQIGYMAHASLVYDELSGMENLRFFARLYGMDDDRPLEGAMTRVGLDPRLSRRAGQYSQGMRQRLSLARAIFHSPRLLLLDEPFSNVDPESAAQIAHLLGAMRASGTTILLITHQLGLLADIADEFLFLSAGELVSRSPRRR